MHDLVDCSTSLTPTLSLRCLVGGLLLLPSLGCVLGEGVLGEYTDTDTNGNSETGADSGSGGDVPGCTEDCDPDFAISYLEGFNYAQQSTYRRGDATCDGERCPAMVSAVASDGSPIEECLQTQAAQDSPLGPEEHCRIAAWWLGGRIDLGFTTPVDRSSFELVRPRPEDPTQEEAYHWIPDVVTLHGPATVLRGDYHRQGPIDHDQLTAVVNETCAERLTALGIPWTPEQLETLCVGTWNDDGVLRPLKMEPSRVLSPFAGELSTDTWSCNTPDAGPDTCCNTCDRVLGPGVARYGVDAAGNRRNPNDGTALACDPEGDALVECRGIVLDVERDADDTYTYAWDGPAQVWPLPRYDKLRETHPDDRPAGLEGGPSCVNDAGCDQGQACIGTNAAGDACSEGEDCTARTCRAEWFGACQATTGGAGFCVDRRFSQNGAGACMVATTDFTHGLEGDRLVRCDVDGDSLPTPAECCDAALGGMAGCDPFYQPNLVEVPRHDRDPSLPAETACVCEEGAPASCADSIDAWCEPPVGAATDPSLASQVGEYAVAAVARLGGVRWDEDDAELSVRLATRGQVPRATTEACAEARGLIGGRNPADGWLANIVYAEQGLREDHDILLCSGSSYRLVFSESTAPHHVRSAAGGTLDGRAEHVIETPQLRIAPGSLEPQLGATFESCLGMQLRLSNAYDPSEANLRKLELREGAVDGPRVAGGPDCDPAAGPVEIAAGAIPCLGFDAAGSFETLAFYVDEDVHGPVLQPGTTYFVVLPGLADIAQMADAEAYAAAFHDACGMPLIVGDTPEELALWELSFTVDEPCS